MSVQPKSYTVAPEANRIRGQAFRCLLDAAEEVLGQSSKERVLANLSRDVAEAFRYGAIVSSGWFPISWYRELHLAIRKTFPAQSDIHRRLGFVATERDINQIYRFILSFTSPKFALSHVGRILGIYFGVHTFELVENQQQAVKARLTIPGVSQEIWLDICGSCEAILVACGGHSGRVTIQPLIQPDTAQIDATWVEASEC